MNTSVNFSYKGKDHRDIQGFDNKSDAMYQVTLILLVVDEINVKELYGEFFLNSNKLCFII